MNASNNQDMNHFHLIPRLIRLRDAPTTPAWTETVLIIWYGLILLRFL